ncbi:N-acetylmuramoyl-L-alanine amidase family protein [Luteibacter sp.]|uniref:N-acetylmuramoyl-L-alanine amidase family protein n=1 Tax=Luteibacter sp. TaxID=1886636 RepID=UPI003F808262
MLKEKRKGSRARIARLAIGIATCLAVCPAWVAATESELGALEDAGVEDAIREIKRIANDVANGRSFFEPDLRPIPVEASYSAADGILYFDFDARLGSEAGYTEVNDLATCIESSVEGIFNNLPGFTRISYRFGGHDTGWWLDHPDGVELATASRKKRQAPDPSPKEQGPVVVAGGHGLYYHHEYNQWTAQRAEVNKVLEDDVAQAFADKLHAHLRSKQIASENLRALRGDLAHEPSGKRWWNVAARYHLEAIRPELSEVWNSESGSKAKDVERRQDIRSRPLYANHVNAPAVLHIHTNADVASASGTRAFVYPGRSEDARLGSLILCGMSELIHSVDAFAGYKVPLVPTTYDRHGENRLAKVPSVIVEVGFHTNPEDARYLIDEYFQSVSMRGAAKGYRLFRDGKTCLPFAIQSDQSTDVVVWGRGKLPVELGGNPDFPVKVITQKLNCETCKPDLESIWDASSVDKFRVEHSCRPEDLDRSPIGYQVTAVDASGVRSNVATYTFNCVPRKATPASHKRIG